MDRNQRLAALYDAFNRRDIDAVLAALAPDVVWPNGWEGGVLHGRDEVRDYWTRQWAAIDPTVVPLAFDDESDGRVRVTVHQIVRTLQGALAADEMVQHVYRFRPGDDDLVDEMEIRHDPS
jgi:nuclear transport factor 2 (NTF2) superfamily protein